VTALKLWENPIFVKHCRSRLRRQHLVPLAIILGVLVACYCYGVELTARQEFIPLKAYRGAFMLLLWAEAGVLLWGIAQVAASLARAKELGVLDFHRISPLSPHHVALGFILGAPIREYVIYVALLPVLVTYGLLAELSGFQLFTLVASQLFSSLLFQTFIPYMVFQSRRPSATIGGAVFVTIAVHMMAAAESPAQILTWLPAFYENVAKTHLIKNALSFYGWRLSGLMPNLVYQVPLLVCLWLMAVRRFRSDRGPALSRPLAAALLLVAVLLITGYGWGTLVQSMLVTYVYGLCLVATVISTALAPSPGALASGFRRARRRNRKAPSAWEDHAPLLPWLAVLVVPFVLMGVLVPKGAFLPIGSRETWGLVLCGSLWVGGSALAVHYFKLRFDKKAGPVTLLYVFFLWIVPLILAGLAAAAKAKDLAGKIIALSPVIAVGAFGTVDAEHDAVRVIALLSLLVPAGLFGWLASREVTRIRSAAQQEKPL
jgi:hypothetical protein